MQNFAPSAFGLPQLEQYRPAAAVVSVVVGVADVAAVPSFFSDSSRNVRTPLPSWPNTVGSFPAPKTMSTMMRTKTSSGPPRLNGMVTSSWRARARGISFPSVREAGSAEEAVQQREEQRDHHEEHEGR